ncbi:MAG: TlyA family RNA methyltransferase [SAR324 cluster bacterium]|nr:TlyA family RNA methyltransferase [SAR324 cluster bacterium]
MKTRIDQLLVERGLVESREKGQALILAGKVKVNGVPVDKAGKMFEQDATLEVEAKVHPYVSRGGLKMEHALEVFGISPQHKIVMDIGASTGGFTHCLLLQGAEHVYAVDVGYGQLAWELQQHPAVTSLERTNIRHLPFEKIGKMMDLIVIDASFISLKLIFPKTHEFLKPGGDVIALVKPQFEAGRQEIGKRGKVSDEDVHARVQQEITDAARLFGFEVCQWSISPIEGKKSNNREFLVYLKKLV